MDASVQNTMKIYPICLGEVKRAKISNFAAIGFAVAVVGLALPCAARAADNGYTPLHWAACRGYADVIEVLIGWEQQQKSSGLMASQFKRDAECERRNLS